MFATASKMHSKVLGLFGFPTPTASILLRAPRSPHFLHRRVCNAKLVNAPGVPAFGNPDLLHAGDAERSVAPTVGPRAKPVILGDSTADAAGSIANWEQLCE